MQKQGPLRQPNWARNTLIARHEPLERSKRCRCLSRTEDVFETVLIFVNIRMLALHDKRDIANPAFSPVVLKNQKIPFHSNSSPRQLQTAGYPIFSQALPHRLLFLSEPRVKAMAKLPKKLLLCFHRRYGPSFRCLRLRYLNRHSRGERAVGRAFSTRPRS